MLQGQLNQHNTSFKMIFGLQLFRPFTYKLINCFQHVCGQITLKATRRTCNAKTMWCSILCQQPDLCNQSGLEVRLKFSHVLGYTSLKHKDIEKAKQWLDYNFTYHWKFNDNSSMAGSANMNNADHPPINGWIPGGTVPHSVDAHAAKVHHFPCNVHATKDQVP
jgi:hypothetical protein